jgi:hypothetical protein
LLYEQRREIALLTPISCLLLIPACHRDVPDGTNGVSTFESDSPPILSVLAITRFEELEVSPDTPGRAALGFAAVDLTQLKEAFETLEVSKNGREYGLALVVTSNGKLAASSQPDQFSYKSEQAQALMHIIRPLLLECGLITELFVTTMNASSVLSSSETTCAKKFDFQGNQHHMQAALLVEQVAALPWTAVLITRDYDFYGPELQYAWTSCVIASSIALFIGVLITLVATQLLTRPLASISHFMQRVSQVTMMSDSSMKKAAMAEVQLDWMAVHQLDGYRKKKQRRGVVGNVVKKASLTPDGTPKPIFVRRLVEQQEDADAGDLLSIVHTQPSALQQREAEMANERRSKLTGVALKTAEVQHMEVAFAEMLDIWAGYDELEALNHSKRQFIRCQSWG